MTIETVYILYALAAMFIIFMIHGFIRKKMKRIIGFLIASMLSGGSGYKIQQELIKKAVNTASSYVSTEINNRIHK